MRLKPASTWTGSRRTAPPDISANARTFLRPPRTSACLVCFGRGRLDERAFIVQYLVGPRGSFVLAVGLPSQMERSVWSGTFR